MNIKKKILVLLASITVAFSASPFALAAPTEDNTDTQQQQQTQIDTQQTAQVTTAPAAEAVPAEAQTESMSERGYLSKGWAAFWFILILLLNSVLSFWIGNRFYRLSRKDNHISAEIRALKKDIEEKFAKSIGGFAETEVDINNTNESYDDGDDIRLPDKKPVLREVSAEEEARFRKWEEAQTKSRAERVRPKSAVKEELDEELDDVKRIHRKNYQPKRKSSERIDEDSELDKTREMKIGKSEGVKNKAKEILGDIFPFKED